MKSGIIKSYSMLQTAKNVSHFLIGSLSTFYFRFPARHLTIIGVTGTDGKTTTTHLIHHILKTAGKKAAMISSVYAEIGGKRYDTGFHVTTPDPADIQRYLRQAVDAGEKYFVLETTSHALAQNRVSGIDFTVAVVTNITHEHLDYHKTYREYLQTKEKLLKRAKIAIVNKDDTSFTHFGTWSNRQITYAVRKTADFTPHTFPFTSSLPGEYNRYNCLAAIAVCSALGIKKHIIRNALATFRGVKGRLEKVSNKAGRILIIDFAHTPNALEQILTTVRKMTRKKIIVIFGCAGLRDRTKRPLMGGIAAKRADYIILTAEDPRTEDVRDIIDQIASGCMKEKAQEADKRDKKIHLLGGKTYFWRIPDRQEAVNFAIRRLSKKGDLVLLCGKSHEQSMCYGTTEYPWDEKKAVEKALYGTVKKTPSI